MSYLITGWHKDGPPNKNAPWKQSKGRTTCNPNARTTFGFEDGVNTDYNDTSTQFWLEQ